MLRGRNFGSAGLRLFPFIWTLSVAGVMILTIVSLASAFAPSSLSSPRSFREERSERVSSSHSSSTSLEVSSHELYLTSKSKSVKRGLSSPSSSRRGVHENDGLEEEAA